MGEWSRAGDLEIPLAFLFTLAAAFFLLAWTGRKPRRRYALIAGLMLGIGLWTKPTMGAFLLGMGAAACCSNWLRVRFDCARGMAALRVALLTGIAALPLGGVWYVRNIALGLPPLVFPPAFWQTLAQRSGGEFGWPAGGAGRVGDLSGACAIRVTTGDSVRSAWRWCWAGARAVDSCTRAA